MTYERLVQIERQLSGIPRERLLEMRDELNRWTWPEELGETPAGWENMSLSEKREHMNDWFGVIGSKFNRKEMLRYHHIRNLHRTEQQFEDWWDSEILNWLELISKQTAIGQFSNTSFVRGVCAGSGITALIVSLTALLARLC